MTTPTVIHPGDGQTLTDKNGKEFAITQGAQVGMVARTVTVTPDTHTSNVTLGEIDAVTGFFVQTNTSGNRYAYTGLGTGYNGWTQIGATPPPPSGPGFFDGLGVSFSTQYSRSWTDAQMAALATAGMRVIAVSDDAWPKDITGNVIVPTSAPDPRTRMAFAMANLAISHGIKAYVRLWQPGGSFVAAPSWWASYCAAWAYAIPSAAFNFMNEPGVANWHALFMRYYTAARAAVPTLTIGYTPAVTTLSNGSWDWYPDLAAWAPPADCYVDIHSYGAAGATQFMNQGNASGAPPAKTVPWHSPADASPFQASWKRFTDLNAARKQKGTIIGELGASVAGAPTAQDNINCTTDLWNVAGKLGYAAVFLWNNRPYGGWATEDNNGNLLQWMKDGKILRLKIVGPFPVPGLSVKVFGGAVGDGKTDDTAAIQKTFDAGKARGEPVYIDPGTYLHGVLSADSITVYGAGVSSIFKAKDPTKAALYLRGTAPALYSVKRDSSGTKRIEGDGDQNSVYVDHAINFEIANCEFTGCGSASIIHYGASNGHVHHNYIHDTFKDGIHLRDGSHDILVEYNKIFHCGDDGVAVVSYGPTNPPAPPPAAMVPYNITVQFNEDIESIKGRGMTCVGGRSVKILNNYVKGMHYGDLTKPGGLAGIYVSGESSFSTAPSSDVLSQGNTIVACGGPPTGHGAWMVFCDDVGQVGNSGIVSKGDVIAGPLGAPVVVNGPYKGQVSIDQLTVYWNGTPGTEISDQTVPHQITKGTITSKPLASFVDPGGVSGAGIDPAFVPPPLR